jgi:hypothetical protein
MAVTVTEKEMLVKELREALDERLRPAEVEHPAVTAQIVADATARTLQELGVTKDIEEIEKLRKHVCKLQRKVKRLCAALVTKMTGKGVDLSPASRNNYYRAMTRRDGEADFHRFPEDIRDGMVAYRDQLIAVARKEHLLTAAIDAANRWYNQRKRAMMLARNAAALDQLLAENAEYLAALQLPGDENKERNKRQVQTVDATNVHTERAV